MDPVSAVSFTRADYLDRLYQQAAGRTQAAGGASAAAGTSAVDAAAGDGITVGGPAARGADFASAIGRGLDQLESMDRIANERAVQAATGTLTDVHDYVIAATTMQTATELTTTVRNKALDAFGEIMRMPL